MTTEDIRPVLCPVCVNLISFEAVPDDMAGTIPIGAPLFAVCPECSTLNKLGFLFLLERKPISVEPELSEQRGEGKHVATITDPATLYEAVRSQTGRTMLIPAGLVNRALRRHGDKPLDQGFAFVDVQTFEEYKAYAEATPGLTRARDADSAAEALHNILERTRIKPSRKGGDA